MLKKYIKYSSNQQNNKKMTFTNSIVVNPITEDYPN